MTKTGRKRGCLGLRGDKHPNSKLSNQARRNIRHMAKRGYSMTSIRTVYREISRTTIRAILASEFDYAD